MSDFVQVKGGKAVPTELHWELRSFDFDDRENTNGHNEGRVDAVCGGFDLFSDTFRVDGAAGHDGDYHLEMSFDSESAVGLWNEGLVRFDYDAAADRWAMTARYEGREWTFCAPERVLDIILDGLACFASQAEATAAIHARNLADSLRQDRDPMIASAARYVNESGSRIGDCSYTPTPTEIDWSDVHTWD